ncbi:MAG: polysaccharide deacetylase family protein [Solirubrobacteraceae bacterium]
MDDLETRVSGGAPPRAQTEREAAPRALSPTIYRRRRRAGALAVISVLALVIGVFVGAQGGGRSAHHAAPTARHFSRIKTPAGGGPASVAAAEQRDQNAAIDRTLAYTPYVRIAGSQHREMALTFDDGPGPYTPAILAILEREHVPATFFEVGILEQYFHASTAAIVARGYPIGDHTETHAPMSQLSPKLQQQQLLEQTAAIGDYGAPFPRLFRPPYGLWDSATLALLRKYRMLMVLWSVDSNDYELPGVNAIVDRVLDGARPGAIILLHDAGGNRSQTVAALPEIIHGLRRRGFKLVTVPKLLLDNPAPKDQDLAYLQGSGS